MPGLALAAVLGAGCKSDLNQQLLERELRYQEDQIYKLQDDLQSACLRLESASGENASLRRQLGVADDAGPRSAPVRRSAPLPAPVAVPPALEIPDAILAPSGPSPAAPPGGIAPPALEGVPPLPTETRLPAADPQPVPAGDVPGGLSLPAADPQAAAPLDKAGRRVGYDEPLPDGGPATHLVVNPEQTACLDADGDGTSDGLTVVFETRDAQERLVAVTGPVSIAVFDAATAADPATGEATPIARWDIPAEEALARFRRTSRARGMQFQLPWQGRGPQGSHIRVAVRLVAADGTPLETDATIAAR
jgi:hypothetical protein